ncbi:MAG TPA: hypothetical protein H9804_10400 [Candidatus Mucispirillum faecigallinarum]|uniref:Uncharacterized protein n=1 Tax=Candidatus Mucispirillum faecigallinarum TaxID=2838699 RepID=A0A9D2GWK5_9BACT|nr:hypothetical protein [Candidatus Mucispirillum faecigallinarum]
MDISVVKNIFDSILAGKFTKEHVELLREQLLLLEKENQLLKAEIAELKKENTALKSKTITEEFQDFGNFLLKKSPNGSYFSTPYCPKCKEPLSEFGELYVCTNEIIHSFSIMKKETDKAIETILTNL